MQVEMSRRTKSMRAKKERCPQSSGRRLEYWSGGEKGFDAGEEDVEAVGLGDDSGDTKGRSERFTQDVAEHRINDDRDERQPGAEQRSGFNAVHVRHGEIEDDEVGLKGDCFIDGFDTIRSFTANFKRGMVLQKNAHRISNGNFVFNNENAFGHRREKHSTAAFGGE